MVAAGDGGYGRDAVGVFRVGHETAGRDQARHHAHETVALLGDVVLGRDDDEVVRGRIAFAHRLDDGHHLAAVLDLRDVVEVEDAVGNLAGEQRARGVGPERHLLHVVERHVAAAAENGLQRDRTRAARRVDADLLALDVLAGGLLQVGGAELEIRLGEAVDARQRHAGIGDLADEQRGRRHRRVDVAGDHGAGGGGAVVELAQLDVDAVFLEEALVLRHEGDDRDENGRHARRRQHDLGIVGQGRPRQRRRERSGQQGRDQDGFTEHRSSSPWNRSACFSGFFTSRSGIRPSSPRS